MTYVPPTPPRHGHLPTPVVSNISSVVAHQTAIQEFERSSYPGQELREMTRSILAVVTACLAVSAVTSGPVGGIATGDTGYQVYESQQNTGGVSRLTGSNQQSQIFPGSQGSSGGSNQQFQSYQGSQGSSGSSSQRFQGTQGSSGSSRLNQFPIVNSDYSTRRGLQNNLGGNSNLGASGSRTSVDQLVQEVFDDVRPNGGIKYSPQLQQGELFQGPKGEEILHIPPHHEEHLPHHEEHLPHHEEHFPHHPPHHEEHFPHHPPHHEEHFPHHPPHHEEHFPHPPPHHEEHFPHPPIFHEEHISPHHEEHFPHHPPHHEEHFPHPPHHEFHGPPHL